MHMLRLARPVIYPLALLVGSLLVVAAGAAPPRLAPHDARAAAQGGVRARHLDLSVRLGGDQREGAAAAAGGGGGGRWCDRRGAGARVSGKHEGRRGGLRTSGVVAGGDRRGAAAPALTISGPAAGRCGSTSRSKRGRPGGARPSGGRCPPTSPFAAPPGKPPGEAAVCPSPRRWSAAPR